MRERLGSATGRGLVSARLGEFIALGAAAAYLLFGQRAWLLVFGLAVAAIPALRSVRRLWVGRFEFGPEHERNARRGAYAFAGAAILFVLALLSFQTFPSPSLGLDFPGDNETVDAERVHRFKDLYPPILLLSLGFALETVSGGSYLWALVGATWRRWAALYFGSGSVAALTVFVVGWRKIQEFEARTGAYVDSQPAAMAYYQEFLDVVLLVFVEWLVLTRVAAVLLLNHAVKKVAEAEQDAAAEPPAGPASA